MESTREQSVYELAELLRISGNSVRPVRDAVLEGEKGMKRVAKFEKVSLEQFMEGWTDAFGTQRPGVIEQIYDGICLPKRGL